MPAVQRQGDPNSSGGVNTSGVASVRVNGRPIVVPGISVTPHPCCGQPGCGIHCSAVTSGGSGTVRAGSQATGRRSCIGVEDEARRARTKDGAGGGPAEEQAWARGRGTGLLKIGESRTRM